MSYMSVPRATAEALAEVRMAVARVAALTVAALATAQVMPAFLKVAALALLWPHPIPHLLLCRRLRSYLLP